MIIRSVNLIVFALFFSGAVAQVFYAGRQLPSGSPQLFSTGILSDGLSNRDFIISSKDDEILFTPSNGGDDIYWVKFDMNWLKYI
jgi:hypothetical protein